MRHNCTKRTGMQYAAPRCAHQKAATSSLVRHSTRVAHCSIVAAVGRVTMLNINGSKTSFASARTDECRITVPRVIKPAELGK